ncbi:MAG TPA: hypothetical protein VIB79_04260 [Candidatus Binatia bacterium]|jgi:hypothetical protein
MVEEINKLFGRDFVIAYFVPSLAFILTTMAYLHLTNRPVSWLTIDPKDPLKDSTFIALITLAVSFCLMSINRLVIRTLEGYWIFDLGRSVAFFQRARFRLLHSRIEKLTAEALRCQRENRVFTKRRLRNRLMQRAAQRFPSQEEQVLCTSFGNTFKAFEDYPRVMYGFESIQGWSRLNSIVPKEFRETLASTRALTDFWANLWFLSLVFLVQYLLLQVFFFGQLPGWRNLFFDRPGVWFLYGAMVVVMVACWQARVAAQQWGEWVKASFDVFLPVLCAKLGYKRPPEIEAERDFWKKVSEAMIYRDPLSLEELNQFRESSAPPARDRADASPAASPREPAPRGFFAFVKGVAAAWVPAIFRRT